jgi:hypothetical protein
VSKAVVPIHGSDHCPGGPDPIPCLTSAIRPWAQLMDGYGGTNAWASATWTPVDFDYAAKYDPDDYYFSWVTTDSGTTGNSRFVLTLEQTGLYHIDCVLGIDITGSAADGLVVLDCQPDQSSHIEFNLTGGSSEDLSLMESKMWSALTFNSLVRVQAVWSNRSGTALQVRARQQTGIARTMGGRYLKAVWIGEHGATTDWTTQDLI